MSKQNSTHTKWTKKKRRPTISIKQQGVLRNFTISRNTAVSLFLTSPCNARALKRLCRFSSSAIAHNTTSHLSFQTARHVIGQMATAVLCFLNARSQLSLTATLPSCFAHAQVLATRRLWESNGRNEPFLAARERCPARLNHGNNPCLKSCVRNTSCYTTACTARTSTCCRLVFLNTTFSRKSQRQVY